MVASPAGAQDASPAITPARITVESPVPPGEDTRLPSLAVRNQGETPLAYRMSALPAGGGSEGGEAASWVRLDPVEFVLQPGEAEPVTLSLEVPSSAAVAEHRLLLQAAVVPEGDASQLQLSVGVGVATVLDFTVGEPRGRGFSLARFWPLLLAAILAGAVANRLAALSERFEWQSPLRRRRPPPPAGPAPSSETMEAAPCSETESVPSEGADTPGRGASDQA